MGDHRKGRGRGGTLLLVCLIKSMSLCGGKVKVTVDTAAGTPVPGSPSSGFSGQQSSLPLTAYSSTITLNWT